MLSSQLSPAATAGRLSRFTRAAATASARHPKRTIALWLALLVACTLAGAVTGTRTLTSVDAGSGQSRAAEQTMQRAGLLNRFNESVIVRSASPVRTAHAVAVLTRATRRAPYVASVTGPNSDPALIADGGRTSLLTLSLRGNPDQQADHIPGLERAVAAARRQLPGVEVEEAGDGSFTQAQNQTISSGLTRAEVIALVLSLLILALVLGTLVAAVVPLALGLTSVGAAMGALGVVSQIAPLGSTTQAVVLLIGLAVGVDYSLFYIRREREARRVIAGSASPTPPGAESAIAAAAGTVGRAILIAGATVVCGLAGLLFTGNSVFVSMALGAMVVVAIAVLGSLTVLPASLALLGPRIDRGRLRRRRARPRPRGRRAGGEQSSAWQRGARAVTARPALALAVALATMGVLAVPLAGMRITAQGSSDLPPDNPTVLAQRQIDRAFPGGTDVAQLVVSGPRLDAPAARLALARLGAVGQTLTRGGGAPVTVSVSAGAGVAVVDIPVPSGPSGVQSANVRALRGALEPLTTRLLPGAHAQLAGDDAANVDFNHQMSVMTPLVVAFVLALAFLLILAAFGSPLLAMAMVGLNLLSVGGAFGVLCELSQHHWTEVLFGLRSVGAITDWLPLFAFVILFGLSMDYTVLILERAAEARRRGASAPEAVTEALGATAATVSGAALVMVAVFSCFAVVPLVSFKQMGIGLAVAIGLDATIVRGLALPAALALLGDRGLPPGARQRSSRRAWEHVGRAALQGAGHD